MNAPKPLPQLTEEQIDMCGYGDVPKRSNGSRVMRANAALVARGGKRIPSGYLQPDAAKALAELIAAGYGTSPVTVIVAAIMDARKKLSRKPIAPQ